jgi:hypothetical protein
VFLALQMMGVLVIFLIDLKNKLRSCDPMNLRKLVVPLESRKAKTIVYDKAHSVSFDISFLSKSEMQKIMSKNTKLVFSPKTHQREEEVDGEAFRSEIIQTCVRGWSGVTFRWLTGLIVIDVDSIPDMAAPVEFTPDNRDTLFTEAYGLDTWLLDTVKNAANFNEKRELEIKN